MLAGIGVGEGNGRERISDSDWLGCVELFGEGCGELTLPGVRARSLDRRCWKSGGRKDIVQEVSKWGVGLNDVSGGRSGLAGIVARPQSWGEVKVRVSRVMRQLNSAWPQDLASDALICHCCFPSAEPLSLCLLALL